MQDVVVVLDVVVGVVVAHPAPLQVVGTVVLSPASVEPELDAPVVGVVGMVVPMPASVEPELAPVVGAGPEVSALERELCAPVEPALLPVVDRLVLDRPSVGSEWVVEEPTALLLLSASVVTEVEQAPTTARASAGARRNDAETRVREGKRMLQR